MDSCQPHLCPHADVEHACLEHTSSVFRPVNPWKMTLQQCLIARHSIDTIRTIDDVRPDVPMFSIVSQEKSDEFQPLIEKKSGAGRVTFGWRSTTVTFLTDWLPRQIFINLLFHIPSIYLSRIDKTFREAGESLVDMKRRAQDESSGIEQQDVQTFDLTFVPIHIGRYFTTDLSFILHYMLKLIFMFTLAWTFGKRSQKRMDPVSETLAILVFFSDLVAVFSFLTHITAPNYRVAAWNFNVAMDTRGIHQPFFWNICVGLSLGVVWIIWGHIFLAAYIVFHCLMKCWHIPLNGELTFGPLAEVIRYTILGFFLLFGTFSVVNTWRYGYTYMMWGRVASAVGRP